MTPTAIACILNNRFVEVLARVLLCFPFWGSGLAKAIDFSGGVAEMAMFGFNPPVAFNIATIIVQLGGSALIIFNRAVWFGAGALGVFTFITILTVHAFWRLDGEHGIVAFHTATEHVGMIGALILVSILALRPRQA